MSIRPNRRRFRDGAVRQTKDAVESLVGQGILGYTNETHDTIDLLMRRWKTLKALWNKYSAKGQFHTDLMCRNVMVSGVGSGFLKKNMPEFLRSNLLCKKHGLATWISQTPRTEKSIVLLVAPGCVTLDSRAVAHVEDAIFLERPDLLPMYAIVWHDSENHDRDQRDSINS